MIVFIIESINIADRKGIQKHPVESALLIANHGIEGDAHAGNWHRQVSFLAGEAVDAVKKQAAGKLVIKHGDFGENIVTRGIDWVKSNVGDRFVLGKDQAELEITQIGKVCHSHCAIYNAVGDCIMPRMGIFAKVLKGGNIYVGDSGYYDIR